MCDLQTSNERLVFCCILGGGEVKTQGMCDFYAHGVDEEEASTSALYARGTIHQENPEICLV